MVLASSTKQSDLERFNRLGDLVLNFSWSVVKPESPLSDKQRTELDEFLDLVDSQVSSKEPIPEIVWRLVKLNGNLLKLFRSENDAKVLAMALMPHPDAMSEWIYERSSPSKDEGIEWVLSELPLEFSSFVGTMFAETLPGVGTSLWFGRKADQEPYFTGSDSIAAARLVFGVEPKTATKADAKAAELESKAAKSESNGAKSESTKAKAKQPKLVAKKEQPLIARPNASQGEVDIDCIESTPENDRKTFDKGELQALADSIKKHGVLQPILLRPLEGQYRFVIVAGERRWRAAKMAGLKEVPAQITEIDGLQAALARLEENLRRVDLSPIEKAGGIKRLMETHGLTQKQVGEMLPDHDGKPMSQGQVSNMLRLLNLPEVMQKKVADGVLAPTLVRCALPFADVPAIMDGVVEFVENLQKEKRELTLEDLEEQIETLVTKHSRPMRDRSKDMIDAWQKPQKERRYFAGCSAEELKQLDVRKVKLRYGGDQDLAFNVKLFDELNKESLKTRMTKHKALKEKQTAARGVSSKPGGAKSPIASEWQLRNAIGESLADALAHAVERGKDKQTVRAVCLALMSIAEGQLEDVFAGKKRQDYRMSNMADLIRVFNVPVAELDQLLRKCIVAYLRKDGAMQPEEVFAVGTALSVDLLADWKPTVEVREALTDHGRELLDASAGQIPDFLRPYLGMKPKAAKTKKGTAA